MPLYDVVERHRIYVAAPADVTLGVARDMNVSDSCVVRAIFRARELMLGATPPPHGVALPPGLVPAALHLGWGVLSDEAGHEIVLGAVTRPWEANPVFRDLLPRDFAAFELAVWRYRPLPAEFLVLRNQFLPLLLALVRLLVSRVR